MTDHRRNAHGSINTRIARVGETIELAPPGMTLTAALLGPTVAGAEKH